MQRREDSRWFVRPVRDCMERCWAAAMVTEVPREGSRAAQTASQGPGGCRRSREQQRCKGETGARSWMVVREQEQDSGRRRGHVAGGRRCAGTATATAGCRR